MGPHCCQFCHIVIIVGSVTLLLLLSVLPHCCYYCRFCHIVVIIVSSVTLLLLLSVLPHCCCYYCQFCHIVVIIVSSVTLLLLLSVLPHSCQIDYFGYEFYNKQVVIFLIWMRSLSCHNVLTSQCSRPPPPSLGHIIMHLYVPLRLKKFCSVSFNTTCLRSVRLCVFQRCGCQAVCGRGGR